MPRDFLNPFVAKRVVWVWHGKRTGIDIQFFEFAHKPRPPSAIWASLKAVDDKNFFHINSCYQLAVYSTNSSNAFRRRRRLGSPPACVADPGFAEARATSARRRPAKIRQPSSIARGAIVV